MIVPEKAVRDSATGRQTNGAQPRPPTRRAGSARRSGPERLRSAPAQEVRAALRPFTIPKWIYLVRLALIPFFVLATVGGDHKLALLLFVAAGASDALDGLVARDCSGCARCWAATPRPIADKTLLGDAHTWALTLPTPTVRRGRSALADRDGGSRGTS